MLSRATWRWGKPAHLAASVIFVVLTIGWARHTMAYLAEWNDPRSVWHAASQKNRDVRVFQYLGTHYQDAADELERDLASGEAGRRKAELLARAVWAEDDRLIPLLNEWEEGEPRGPVTSAYKSALLKRAEEQYQEALTLKGTRLTPNLHFRLGKLAMESGNYDEAIRRFNRAYAEAANHTSVDVRNELTVRSYHALALTYWRMRDYPQATEWLERTEAEQKQRGRIWIPELPEQRETLDRLLQNQLRGGGTPPSRDRREPQAPPG
jgi:tetratricopeptide (TPR) repeat protein